MRTFTATEIAELLGDEAIEKTNEALARGDGIAIYQNQDLSSSTVGERRFFSFGGPEAEFGVPPERLPDFPGEINWRFNLEGTYRGRPLTPPSTHDWATPQHVLELLLGSFRSQRPGDPDRLVSYAMAVKRFAHGPSHVTYTLDVTGGFTSLDATVVASEPQQVNDALVGGTTITVTCWTDERGLIDRLASFSWVIERPEGIGGVADGSDPNLGGTIVSVHNLSLTRQEA